MSVRQMLSKLTLIAALAVQGTASCQEISNYESEILGAPTMEELRFAIRKAGNNSDLGLKTLVKVWFMSASNSSQAKPMLINDSIARLEIAENLIRNNYGPIKELETYVREMADSQNAIVRANAADALGVIGDDSAVDLLYGIALTPNRFVSTRALEAMRNAARTRKYDGYVRNALRELSSDERLEDVVLKRDLITLIKQIDDEAAQDSVSFVPASSEDSKNEIANLVNRANQGDVLAQHELGERLVLGAGIEVDYTQAYSWLLKAAENNYPPAMMSLANLYLTGRGTEKNKQRAIDLLVRASELGYEPAKKLLKLLEE